VITEVADLRTTPRHSTCSLNYVLCETIPVSSGSGQVGGTACQGHVAKFLATPQ